MGDDGKRRLHLIQPPSFFKLQHEAGRALAPHFLTLLFLTYLTAPEGIETSDSSVAIPFPDGVKKS